MFSKDIRTKMNEHAFQKQGVVELPYLNTADSTIVPTFFLKLENKTESRICSCCSCDHIARAHRHESITGSDYTPALGLSKHMASIFKEKGRQIEQAVINLHTKYEHSSLHGCREIVDKKNSFFIVWKERKVDKCREE